jgi:hypothetical protein
MRKHKFDWFILIVAILILLQGIAVFGIMVLEW